jgi:hypothetical protein
MVFRQGRHGVVSADGEFFCQFIQHRLIIAANRRSVIAARHVSLLNSYLDLKFP